MSLELHVLSNKKLPSVAAWQEAINAEGFNLKLEPSVALATVRGFLPARLREKQSGFECYHDDARDIRETYHDVLDLTSNHQWQHAFSLRWGRALEGASAYMAAAAYAQATGGAVFDPQEGRILTLAECCEFARQCEKLEFRA
jgi:hypothetical protein